MRPLLRPAALAGRAASSRRCAACPARIAALITPPPPPSSATPSKRARAGTGVSADHHRLLGCRLFAASSRASGELSVGPQRVLMFSPLWPEPSSSAAGVRTIGLVEAFLSWGWQVAYLSSSKPSDFSDHLQGRGVATFSLKPNRREELEAILHEVKPTICLFDRFFAEEAFSFVVRDALPDTLRILDTQDLHFLRNGRHDALKAALKTGKLESVLDILRHLPGAESPAFLRELAALYRSDLNIMCSPVEVEMLKLHYGMTPSKVALSSFLCEAAPLMDMPGYSERQHFMTIGNFKHPPNMDSVKWLATEIWADIRQGLAAKGINAELHVYGAYPSQEAMQLSRPKDGFRVLGHAPSLDIMRGYRVCLTPLRFGAGLKGKVLDSWAHGLPVCTTPIGAEGLFAEGFPHGGNLTSWLDGAEVAATRMAIGDGGTGEWGGTWAATTADEIASDAIRLYSDQTLWNASQEQGYNLLQSLFSAEHNKADLYRDIASSLTSMQQNRQRDFVGSMLWHQNNRATEFFSRWLELKERTAEALPSSSNPP